MTIFPDLGLLCPCLMPGFVIAKDFKGERSALGAGGRPLPTGLQGMR